jgi:nicotinamidase-related amidase
VRALKRDIEPHAVHLCVDMQRLFSSEGPWPAPWMERVLPNVAELVTAAPHRTVFTRFITPPSPRNAGGMWNAYYEKWRIATRDKLPPELLDLMPELQRFVPPAKVLDKSVYSAFADGTLHAQLRRDDVNTLIFTGAETDVCVLSSVLAAVDYGYRVIIADDAVCSSSDASHDALIELYSRRFDIQIELSRVGEIIEAWKR